MGTQYREQPFTLHLYRSEWRLNENPLHAPNLVSTVEVYPNDTAESLLEADRWQHAGENEFYWKLKERYGVHQLPASISFDIPPQLPKNQEIPHGNDVFKIRRGPLNNPRLEALINKQFEEWKDRPK